MEARMDTVEVPSEGLQPDVRLEVRAKNNALYNAIYGSYESVAGMCNSEPELMGMYVSVIMLLNFRLYPIKQNGRYRKVCRLLEEILDVPRERLFPLAMYERIGQSGNLAVLEASSSTGLITAVRQTSLLPASTGGANVAESHTEVALISAQLPERQRLVMERRCGLFDGRCWSRREVAEALKMTIATVALIEQRARENGRRLLKRLPLLPDKIMKLSSTELVDACFSDGATVKAVTDCRKRIPTLFDEVGIRFPRQPDVVFKDRYKIAKTAQLHLERVTHLSHESAIVRLMRQKRRRPGTFAELLRLYVEHRQVLPERVRIAAFGTMCWFPRSESYWDTQPNVPILCLDGDASLSRHCWFDHRCTSSWQSDYKQDDIMYFLAAET